MKETIEEAARTEALQAERQRVNREVKGAFSLGPARPGMLECEEEWGETPDGNSDGKVTAKCQFRHLGGGEAVTR